MEHSQLFSDLFPILENSGFDLVFEILYIRSRLSKNSQVSPKYLYKTNPQVSKNSQVSTQFWI